MLPGACVADDEHSQEGERFVSLVVASRLRDSTSCRSLWRPQVLSRPPRTSRETKGMSCGLSLSWIIPNASYHAVATASTQTIDASLT